MTASPHEISVYPRDLVLPDLFVRNRLSWPPASEIALVVEPIDRILEGHDSRPWLVAELALGLPGREKHLLLCQLDSVHGDEGLFARQPRDEFRTMGDRQNQIMRQAKSRRLSP